MSLGTLYILPGSSRNSWLPGLVKYLGLDVKVVSIRDIDNYKSIFPLGKAPAFEATNGFKVTEVAAVVEYLILQSAKPELLGSTKEEKVSNTRWFSFTNTDVGNTMVAWNRRPQDSPEEVATRKENVHNLFKYLNNHYASSKYVVGDNITVADLYLYTDVTKINANGIPLDGYPHLEKYISTVSVHPALSG